MYFSTPEGVKPGMDYLVDHSIYFYLMGKTIPTQYHRWLADRKIDPEGDFVEAIGRQHSAERAAKIILEHMKDWQAGAKR